MAEIFFLLQKCRNHENHNSRNHKNQIFYHLLFRFPEQRNLTFHRKQYQIDNQTINHRQTCNKNIYSQIFFIFKMNHNCHITAKRTHYSVQNKNYLQCMNSIQRNCFLWNRKPCVFGRKFQSLKKLLKIPWYCEQQKAGNKNINQSRCIN